MSETTPIWRDYDRAALDAQYNNRKRFPNFTEHFEFLQRWSVETRAKLGGAVDLAFGPAPVEKLDVFGAEKPGAPVYVFIHGGYWYSLDKDDYSDVAEGMRPHGLATAVNNFGLAPDWDMDEIVRQIGAALALLWRNVAEYGGDPERIYVAGHLCGGHLAAMLLATDWPSFETGLPPGVVKGACAIGGIFDLEPIRLCYLNDTLHLTPEQVVAHSPLNQTYPVSAPLLLVVAEDELPEFHRQSDEMAEFWRGLGYPVDSVVPDGLDHFDVVNQLRDPDCGLVKLQLDHMRQCFEMPG